MNRFLAIPLLTLATLSFANESDPVEAVCERFDPELRPVCIAVASEALTGGDRLPEILKTELTRPELLNTALSRQFGDEIPLGLEFKAIDTDDGGTVLGLGYDISYAFRDWDVTASNGDWNRRISASFKATGTITENSRENPRNLLESDLTLFASLSTNIPDQDDEFNLRLTNAAAAAAVPCAADNESPDCRSALDTAYGLLDQTVAFLDHGIQYYEFGLNAGYETDQRFDASQSKLSAYVFGQYESWGDSSIFPFDVVPAVRLGIDQVNPGSETPRAIAGDSSTYYRVAAEASIWMPIRADVPLAFTFNYRHFREIDAGSIVQDANLDRYSLRTFSLRGANGLFVSFSSGRLPFDRQDDNVVELGWKTYFME